MNGVPEAIRQDIAKMRTELEEANNMLAAIRSGRVDALLVSGKHGDQVYVLKGTDRLYRTIVEEMQEGYATLSPEGTILFCNKNFAATLGRGIESLIGSSIFDIIKPADRGIFEWVLSEREGSFRAEFNLKAGTGLCVPALIAANSIAVDDESFTCLVVTDLSEQKRNEKLMQQVFRQSTEAIAVCDKQGRVLKANKAAALLAGEELVGCYLDEKLPLVDNLTGQPFQVAEEIGNCITKQREVRFESSLGETYYLIVNLARLSTGEEDSFYGYLVTVTNVTEIKKYTAEIMRLDKFNAIGEMAASIGHEVRNPLTTVRGYLQMFRSKPLFTPYDGALRLMIEELDRANTIITEFLSLAKNKIVQLMPIDLNEVVSNIFPLIQADAFRRKSEIKLNLVPLPKVLGDEKELRQYILNLVRNGLDAMPGGGSITISTCLRNRSAILAIKDEGCGIPPHIRERIGTPFITTKETGTGLGLPVCYSIASRHKAEIEIDSSPQGTTFSLVFVADNYNIADAD